MRTTIQPAQRLAAIAFATATALLSAAGPAQAGSTIWDLLASGLGYANVDPDRTSADQPRLLAQTMGAVAPERPGVADLYLVTLAGDGRSGVFRREVASVTQLFADRFGSAGRSVMLVNSPRTVGTVPLATPENLRQVLADLGALMDRREDVLFLFLTSHGSPDEFWIDAGPVAADPLSSDDLRDILDDSGIKWRVLVISACYSGSFIDELRDDHTLVITAARSDRSSFGCSSERDWTYFGEAYFDQALRREWSFIAAFEEAAKTIAAREKAEHLKASLPQIDIGRDIAVKLAELERTVRAAIEAGEPTESDD